MNTLQQIIDEMKAHKEIAEKYYEQTGNAFFNGEAAAISLHLPKLESLLSESSPEGVDKDGN